MSLVKLYTLLLHRLLWLFSNDVFISQLPNKKHFCVIFRVVLEELMRSQHIIQSL